MKPWKTNPFSQCFKSVQQFLFWHYLYFSSLNYNHNFHCFLCFPFYPTSIHEHLFHFCSIIFTEFSINFLLRIESTFCKLPLFWAQSFISSLKWLLAYQLACLFNTLHTAFVRNLWILGNYMLQANHLVSNQVHLQACNILHISSFSTYLWVH